MIAELIGAGLVGLAAWPERRRALDGWTAQDVRDDLEWVKRATSASSIAVNQAGSAERASGMGYLTGPKVRPLRQNRLVHPCEVSRARYFRALDRLKEARRFSRDPRVPEIMKRYQCRRLIPGYGDPPNRIETICSRVNVLREQVDRSIAYLNQARANYNWARRKGVCQRSLPKVPLSGMLDKPVTTSMANPDFVDEMVYRASEFSRNTENTYRELYDEADPDEANNPNCPGARESYAAAVDRRRDSIEAMRSSNARRLSTPCSSKKGVGRSEMCRRFRWARRKHEGAECSFRDLKAEVERYCR